jgi:hypothetical protein
MNTRKDILFMSYLNTLFTVFVYIHFFLFGFGVQFIPTQAMSHVPSCTRRSAKAFNNEESKMNKFTKKEARECQREIKSCNKMYYNRFRLLLIDAYNKKAHEALGLNDFTAFLNRISKTTSNLSTSYMLRQFHAGQIEIETLEIGRDCVGEFPEGAARVLTENVLPENRLTVYKEAYRSKDSKKPHPTKTRLVEAGKKLGFYFQQESKMKEKDKIEDEAVSKKGMKKVPPVRVEDEPVGKKGKKVTSSSNSKASNVEEIKTDKFSLKKLGTELVENLGEDNARHLADMIEWAVDEDLYNKFTEILKTYDVDDFYDIAVAIDNALEPKRAKKVQVV